MHIGRNHKGALIHGKHKLAQAYALHAVHHAKEHRLATSAIHALRGNSRNPAFYFAHQQLGYFLALIRNDKVCPRGIRPFQRKIQHIVHNDHGNQGVQGIFGVENEHAAQNHDAVDQADQHAHANVGKLLVNQLSQHVRTARARAAAQNQAEAKPAQQAFADVARAIARFEPVTMCVNPDQFQNARARLPEDIRVVEMTSNDAWVRDCGPTFVKNDQGDLRAVDWTFNAWGGLHDGLYFPWDQDDLVARKICELEGVDSYRTDGFVLEGGSIHVDGQGTVLTTEMCLLSPGRNPELSRRDIEEKLCDYLGCEKVIWLRDGIDPDETNGHIDDVACFVAPGEVACIWTEDPENPFYQAAQDAFRTLSQATDAKGRRLTVHKLCLTKKPCCLEGAETIDAVEGTVPRENGEVSIASYMNFLIVNGAVIAPQYGDENDQLAIQQLQQMFPDRQIVGVQTREVAFGGGNIHCITQQQPKA